MQKLINNKLLTGLTAATWVIAMCFLLCSFSTFAQNIYNQGSSIILNPSTKVYVTGSYFHFNGSIDNSGELYITDSLVNNASTSSVFNSGTTRPTLGAVVFLSSANQQVSGTGMPVIFYDLRLQNSLSTFKLFRPFELDGTLTLSTGNINLNGRYIDLDNRGTLAGETNNNRIYGASGYIRARKNLSFANTEVADMGFSIDASGVDFGFTELKRNHFALNPFSSNGNINRFFDFKPTNPGFSPANSITIDYFANEKLPAHNASDYKLYHSYKDGFSWIKEESASGDNPEIDFNVLALGIKNLGTSAQGRSLLTISESNCLNGPVVDLGPVSKDICQGASVEILSDPGQQIYTWKKDGVVILGETTNKITVAQAALYELEVIDGNGCAGGDNIIINVKQTPVADFASTNFACLGAASTFSNLSTSPDGTLTHAWNFGDPATTSDVSVQAAPTYVYSTPGTFNATLTVTSQFGCVSTVRTGTVIVNPLPSVNFSSDQVCRTGATTFTNTPVAGINYAWDFGAGNTSNQPEPQFTFVTSGTHPVTLTATNANTGCIKAITKNAVVNSKPIADFSSAVICKPNEFLFTNTSVISNGTLSYDWTFGDGEVGTTEDPFKVYQQASVYDVGLTVTSDLGCTDIITKQVSVTMPVPVFTGNVVTCAGQVVLDGNPGGRFTGGTFQWSNNSVNPQLTVTQTGNYSLTVTMPDGCVTTESVGVTLNSIIAPDLGTNVQACGSHTLDAGFYPAGSYTWSNGQSSQTISVSQSGTYAVQVIDQNGCSGSASADLQINPVPVVDLGADQLLCDGKTAQLDAGTDGNNYRWSDGTTGRFLIAGSSGSYRVTVTNGFGCSAADEARITVLPKVVVDIGPDRVICGGIPLVLDAGLSNVGSYQWGSSNGASGGSKTLQISAGGKYWVSILSSTGCVASDTIMVNETANTLNAEFLAVSEVKPGDTLQFINLSYPIPFTSSWNFGNGTTSTQEDPIMIYFVEGDYTVSLTVTNGVCTDSRTKTVNVRNSTGKVAPKDIEKEDDILNAKVYPNPTNDEINLDVELSGEMKVLVRITSLIGVSFFEKFIEARQINEVISMSGVNPGVYIVIIITDNQTKSMRILKL